MAKVAVVFTFPKEFVEQPLAYRLIKEYDLMINILHAHVRPNEEGKLILDISGEDKSIERGIKLVESTGVRVEPLSSYVSWDEERCSHCTACAGQCPTNALSVDRDSMLVSFDPDICIACGICQNICPMSAMSINLD
ncbi:MAG: NIL domain-containing protein [Planctomycetota bacterium]|jgi:ferredoxin